MAHNLLKSYHDIVKIDDNHASFLTSLVMCKKPRRILELGFGAGESCKAIMNGLKFNLSPYSYTLVDNWMDFGGTRAVTSNVGEFDSINFITSGELEFFQSDRNNYDFIFSDADHFNAQLWFDHVYKNVLSRDGVLIYHDVTNMRSFPNLKQIYDDVLIHGYNHVLFNHNSRPDENCDRGLLVIFKS